MIINLFALKTVEWGIIFMQNENLEVFMAFFEKLGKKIGDAAEAAGDKAKDFAEITKLNNSISAEKKEIDRLIVELGKWAFEAEKSNPESPVAIQCSKILESKKNIESFQEKIEEIKSGPDLEAPVPEVENLEIVTCKNCGAIVPEGSKFCPECGTPVDL